MSRVVHGGVTAALVILAITPTLASAQVRTVARSRLPHNLDSALRAGGLSVVDSARTAPVSPSAATVQLQPGALLAARVASAARLDQRRVPLGMSGGPAETIDTVFVLPFRYLGLTQDQRTVHLRPAVIRESRLRYRPSEGVFRGSLLVGLEDSLAPAVRRELSGAVRLTLASGGDSIAPRDLELAFTNRPLERVTVIAAEPQDSLSVQIVPEFDLRGTVIWLPVDPVLSLEGGPQRMSGLGIQTASVPVRVRGASLNDSVTVTLTVDRGSLEPNQVKVGRSGSATVRLRSAGIGPARITATSPGMNTVQATIHFGWPIVFLAAALLGGALGGLTADAIRAGDQRGRRGKAALVGVLIGFAVAVAYYAVGVNLLAIEVAVPFFDEAAVFGLALLGGLFGIPMLKKKEP